MEQPFPLLAALSGLLSCPGLVSGRGLEDAENLLCAVRGSAWPRVRLQTRLRVEDDGGEKPSVALCGVPVTGAGLVVLGATENLAVPCLPELASGVLSPLSAREAAAEEAGEELLQNREDSERMPQRVVFGSEEGQHRAQPVCARTKDDCRQAQPGQHRRSAVTLWPESLPPCKVPTPEGTASYPQCRAGAGVRGHLWLPLLWVVVLVPGRAGDPRGERSCEPSQYALIKCKSR